MAAAAKTVELQVLCRRCGVGHFRFGHRSCGARNVCYDNWTNVCTIRQLECVDFARKWRADICSRPDFMVLDWATPAVTFVNSDKETVACNPVREACDLEGEGFPCDSGQFCRLVIGTRS